MPTQRWRCQPPRTTITPPATRGHRTSSTGRRRHQPHRSLTLPSHLRDPHRLITTFAFPTALTTASAVPGSFRAAEQHAHRHGRTCNRLHNLTASITNQPRRPCPVQQLVRQSTRPPTNPLPRYHFCTQEVPLAVATVSASNPTPRTATTACGRPTPCGTGRAARRSGHLGPAPRQLPRTPPRRLTARPPPPG